jgi:hypothetical protein
MWCSIQITSNLGANFLSGIDMFKHSQETTKYPKVKTKHARNRIPDISTYNLLSTVAKKTHNWSSKIPNDLKEDILESL